MEFTAKTVPDLDMNKDKFQWILEPECREGDLVELPMNIYDYYNLSGRWKYNKYGYIDDYDRYQRLDHVININHHKYNNTETNMMISFCYSCFKCSMTYQIWYNHMN